jgi:N-acetylmuramoyl-L-alanine amidase
VNGFFPGTIWNHPPNAALKEVRKNPEILMPGDEVAVPDKEQKEAPGTTDRRHRFRVFGVPSKFEVRMLCDDEPRTGLDYEFVIDGRRKVSGRTDDDGWVRVPLMPDAQRGKLILENGAEVYNLQLGFVDPLDSITGVQSRLRNLGFFDGESDGKESDALSDAIAAFQRHCRLEESGHMDEATRSALKGMFGS